MTTSITYVRLGRVARAKARCGYHRVNPRKPLTGGAIFAPLEAGCGKHDNSDRLRALLPLKVPGTGSTRTSSKQAVAMNDNEEVALREQLARLQQEHRDLDAAIAALATSPGSDLIQVQRLKKRKLVLRDKIRQIEDQITPDIIA
jgi:hypothetical protein